MNNNNNNNEYRGEVNRCYFHPKDVVIGVCALCLNEKLLVLAQNQRHVKNTTSHHHHHNISLQKVFALGSLLHRLDLRHHHKSHDRGGSGSGSGASTSSTAQEDSFISINFEDNGKASWETMGNNKVSSSSLSSYVEHGDDDVSVSSAWSKKTHEGGGVMMMIKSVREHGKPRTTSSSLRWRKRIGHLFQVVRWKGGSSTTSSSKRRSSSVCHVASSKMEGVKVRHGWIRTLTKRKKKLS